MQGEYSKKLSKMVYLNHRAFLPSIDTLRKDNRHFPSVSSKSIRPKTMKFVNKANGEAAAARTDADKKRIYQRTGCKGPYSLRRLPSHDRYLNTPVEPMHVIKNISEHIVKLLSGIEDSVKVRREEECRKRFKCAWVKRGHENEALPSAPFSLSVKELALANKRALSVCVPAGMDWKRRNLFNRKSIGYVKSIEWRHVLCSGILKYCIRGLLGEQQRKTLFELCDVVASLLDYGVTNDSIDSLEYRVHRVLSLLERDFPISLHVIVFHLLHHLPMFIRRFGAAHSFWMYPMERFNSWIAARIKNRRYPEATVLESYRLFELSSFMQLSGKLPQDVAADFNDICDASNGMSSASKYQCTCKLLSPEELSHLNDYYRKTDLDYQALVQAYEKDKLKSKHSSSFPSLFHWQPETCKDSLSPSQLELRQGPSSSFLSLPIVKREKKGRTVKYSTASADDPVSFSSSYVAWRSKSSCAAVATSNTDLVFGRIQLILKHRFNSCEHLLAYIHWFDQPEHDAESGLYTVALNSSANHCKVVPLSDLSRPIVHAIDCDDPNKLWVLDFD